MKNADIRGEVSAAGLHLWQIAEALGMADFSLSRRLRHELCAEDKAHIRVIIAEIKGGDHGQTTTI